MSEFLRVGQKQMIRLDGIIRAFWRGPKLVLFFGEGVTQVEGEAAERVWRELSRRSERIDVPERGESPALAGSLSEAAGGQGGD